MACRRLAWVLLPVLCLALLAGCRFDDGHDSVSRTMSDSWGTIDGARVRLYELENTHGLRAVLTDYGATLVQLHVPDRHGRQADIVLGFDSVADYVDRSPYFGCTAGRCANRIAGGRFTLDGVPASLATNNGPNHLHGGERGFDKQIWAATSAITPLGPSVTFTLVSPDGDEGYPGRLEVSVTYTLTHEDELLVDMEATSDAPTVVNLAHHTYWNLAGHDAGTVRGQALQLSAQRYTPVDATLIPTGELALVAGTPFDFRTRKAIGADLDELPPAGDDPGGYDVNFVVDGAAGTMRPVARVEDPSSGRVLEIRSDQAGVQFYSGNWLDGIAGKDGARYDRQDGFCLETQAFPDAVNHQGEAGWPSVILRPGETYRHRMVHAFNAD